MFTSNSLLVTIAVALLQLQFAASHSWVECTNYQIANEAQKGNYDQSICAGFPRGGLRQKDAGFGVDTGSNVQGQCQVPYTDARTADYDNGAPKAQYQPGQEVCLAFPAKNHVAAECTNAFIPDSGTVIKRSAVNQAGDDFTANSYDPLGPKHVNGQMDYQGFQNCPNFCENTDKALCTMCFQLEADLPAGEYSFSWEWKFNEGDSPYHTCWEATVGGDVAAANPVAVANPVAPAAPAANVTQAAPVAETPAAPAYPTAETPAQPIDNAAETPAETPAAPDAAAPVAATPVAPATPAYPTAETPAAPVALAGAKCARLRR